MLDSITEWHRLFGMPPAPYEWNPALCRVKTKHSGDCYARGLERNLSTGRPWPSTTNVYNHFESWPEAVRAAGFEPLAPSERWIGRAGMALRRADEAMAA